MQSHASVWPRHLCSMAVYVYIYIYINLCIHFCVCINTFMCACMCVFTDIHAHTCVCVCVCECVHTCVACAHTFTKGSNQCRETKSWEEGGKTDTHKQTQKSISNKRKRRTESLVCHILMHMQRVVQKKWMNRAFSALPAYALHTCTMYAYTCIWM